MLEGSVLECRPNSCMMVGRLQGSMLEGRKEDIMIDGRLEASLMEGRLKVSMKVGRLQGSMLEGCCSPLAPISPPAAARACLSRSAASAASFFLWMI